MELKLFKDFDNDITKNRQRHIASPFKVPKYTTKVWTIATAASSTKHQVELAKISTQLGRHSILCVAFNVSIDETVFELTSISFFFYEEISCYFYLPESMSMPFNVLPLLMYT